MKEHKWTLSSLTLKRIEEKCRTWRMFRVEQVSSVKADLHSLHKWNQRRKQDFFKTKTFAQYQIILSESIISNAPIS